MEIQAFNDFIGVTELEAQKGTLVVSDCVGLEKVEIFTISPETSKWLYKSHGVYLQKGSIVYIRVDGKQEPYILVDGKKVIFIDDCRIVAVDPSTTFCPDMSSESCERAKESK